MNAIHVPAHGLVGGLLGLLGTALPPERLAAAIAASPWRGPVTARVESPLGCVVALGRAAAVRLGHLIVGWHGRIDNQHDLADRLGVERGDLMAVLAALYLRDGDEFAGHVLGDFAVAVLDERQGRLLAARDWMGVRPLFWAKTQEHAAVASEVKQVLALLDLPFRPDEQTTGDYERRDGSAAADATFCADIRAVLPNGQVRLQASVPARSWQRPLRIEPLDVGLAAAAEALRALLDTAVRRRVIGARQPGAFCTGGMDSPSVAATAAALAVNGEAPPVDAFFTATYPGTPSCDESRFAREVAERWSVPWIGVPIRDNDLREFAASAPKFHDGPIFPPTGIFHRMMRVASDRGIDVLLTGEGGSDFFEQTNVELRLAVMRAEWITVARWLPTYVRRSPGVAARVLAGALRRRFLTAERAESHWERNLTDFWVRESLEFLEREGARHGILVESPFFDRELASFAGGLAVSVRSTPQVAKRVLRHAMRDRLPPSVLNRHNYTYLDEVVASAFGGSPAHEPVIYHASRHIARSWRQHIDPLHANG